MDNSCCDDRFCLDSCSCMMASATSPKYSASRRSLQQCLLRDDLGFGWCTPAAIAALHHADTEFHVARICGRLLLPLMKGDAETGRALAPVVCMNGFGPCKPTTVHVFESSIFKGNSSHPTQFQGMSGIFFPRTGKTPSVYVRNAVITTSKGTLNPEPS